MNFVDFILAHEADDLGRLALSRERFARQVEDFDLALTTLEVRSKLRTKVPEWVAVPSLHFPLRLSGEQCSSSATARYKAAVALAACPGKAAPCVADLTGGLGVDCWAFAQVFGEVLYSEMQPELAAAAQHNFRELGLGNVTVQNATLGASELPAGPGAVGPAASVAAILGLFCPDILYLDPARRSAGGRKVFRLEDCQPQVLDLLPELLEACPRLLLKLSPMADITLINRQLGCVKAVHVVAAEGECKELLLLLEKGCEDPPALHIFENGATAQLPGGETPAYAEALPTDWLFEPGKALLKAGAFDWPCRFGLRKLGRHTHYYSAPEPVSEITPFGKWYQILETVPLNNRSIKETGKRYPQAEVTARNIPLTSDQLRAKLKVASGGAVHLFGLHVDHLNGNFLLICQTPGTRE